MYVCVRLFVPCVQEPVEIQVQKALSCHMGARVLSKDRKHS